MSLMSGPLGSHKGYIYYIALPNCVEYFNICRQQRDEETYQTTRSKYERLRLFLNAVESLNNIPDYIFHECKSVYKWASEGSVRDLLSKKSNIHGTINTLANGYKHCVRHSPKKGGIKEIDASEFQDIKILVGLQMSAPLDPDVLYSFESIEDEEMLAEAFRFWVDYGGHNDLSRLFDGCA